MADKGAQTRERILATAEPMILRQGFAGTSLDDLLKVSGLTKGAFFHHFRDKADFARALVERFVQQDLALFDRLNAEVEAASDDPLEQTIEFLKRFERHIEGLAEPPAGCMLAVYTYESVQFDPSIHAFVTQSFRRWSTQFERRLDALLARYTPAEPVSARDLAETIMSIIEGGFILSRSYNDPAIIARLTRQFRNYIELLFQPRTAKAKPVAKKRRA